MNADTAWIAGLIEGEGCISAPGRTTVSILMRDRDVVERAAAIMGSPGVHIKPRHRPNWSDLYYCAVYGPRARSVLTVIRPWLGERRGARADEHIGWGGVRAVDDLSWLAGLLEGEGCFNRNYNGHSAKIQLEMTDEDVVRRAATLMGVGKVTARAARHGRKSTYHCGLYGAAAAYLMTELSPMMGARRRKAIAAAVAGYT